jgi:hypothetical protein
LGEHELMIRDYLRHSDLHITNKGSPGNDKKQTPGAGEASGCHSVSGRAVGKQINLDPLAREVRFFGCSDRTFQERRAHVRYPSCLGRGDLPGSHIEWGAECSAAFEIILRVQVQFALKEIDPTNTLGVSFEDSTRSPVSTHIKQIGEKDGRKDCRNPEPTAVARGCNWILAGTMQINHSSDNFGSQANLVANHKEDVFRRWASPQSGFHAAAHRRSHTGVPVFINSDDHSETFEGATHPMSLKTKYDDDRFTTGLGGEAHGSPQQWLAIDLNQLLGLTQPPRGARCEDDGRAARFRHDSRKRIWESSRDIFRSLREFPRRSRAQC